MSGVQLSHSRNIVIDNFVYVQYMLSACNNNYTTLIFNTVAVIEKHNTKWICSIAQYIIHCVVMM